MPGAAENNEGAAHDGKEDPSFIVGRMKEQAAFCGPKKAWSAACRNLKPRPLSRGLRQNGLTTTRITIAIISNVGISLIIRQCFADFSLRSSANFRAAPAR